MESGFWGNFDEELNFKTPKEILSEQAEILYKITNGKVYANVSNYNDVDYTSDYFGKFNYRFDIKAKYLSTYVYMAFYIQHDVSIYPVNIVLDEGIAKELNINPKSDGYSIKCISEEEFVSVLQSILSCKQVKKVVSALLKLTQ